MTDGPDRTRVSGRSQQDRPVEALANKALSILARHRLAGPSELSGHYVELLRLAVLEADVYRRDAAISDMRSGGIALEDIIDHYIPAVARRLGEQWCEDGLGFADVTIGSARLQGLVRDLTQELPSAVPRKSGVAVVVLAEDFHTLGAMVLTSQLRRLGVSVRLLVGATPDLVLEELRIGRYDAVLISASHSESLVKLSRFVKNLRQQTDRNMPIVIGGPIVERSTDVAAATGADAATSNLEEALRACRLKISRDGVGKHRTSG